MAKALKKQNPLLELNSPRIETLKCQLAEHRLYAQIDSAETLRLFMAHHIFCVWDFMSLIKSLQFNLTGATLPWRPPANSAMARLINEIVLDEETDCIDGQVTSHFELYLCGMSEIQADTTRIQALLDHLAQGFTLDEAMAVSGVPACAQAFMQSTFRSLQETPEVQAAVFFHARESIIPPMFIEMVQHLQHTGLNCQTLLVYLQRHIALDGDTHGPKAQELLQHLFHEKTYLIPVAIEAIESALQARLALWDVLSVMVTGLKN